MAKEYKKQKAIKAGIFALALLGGVIFCCAVFLRPKAQREDYRQIASSEYDTVFLAMYPIDTYNAEDFLVYRGMTVLKASYCIPDYAVLKQYMKRIAASDHLVSTVYLGIRPDKIDFQELKALCALYPAIDFEMILSYPSIDYWRGLTAVKYEKVMDAYCSFLSAASDIPNAHFYCIGSQEWLAANPGNYRDEWTVNERIAQKIMLYCDILQEYYVTFENGTVFFQELEAVTQKMRNPDFEHHDLSDHCVVFFGDSVIGNYTDSTSIPEVVAGLTGAKVYNCGYGGNSAAMGQEQIIALAGIAEAFAEGELPKVPSNLQVYQGLAAYLSDSPRDMKLCVVVNYGLNDYFSGYPISSEATPYDITTYCGAVRRAVEAIRGAYPDAQIILCTPSYCADFQFGMEPHGEAGYILTDYVEAILDLAAELETSVLDTYHGFHVSQENWADYLLDQVHPNEAYRYLIGAKISSLIR